MLTIFGSSRAHSQTTGFCDRQNRRDFLTIGGMMLGGLTLPQLLSAEAQGSVGRSHKAIINVFLPGGPPHQDMWDLKPDAPSEIRGEFQPISTNVSGIEIGEIFPKIAAIADKCVFIRSMIGATGGHDAYQCMTGRPLNPAAAGGWPAAGAWISKLKGPVNQAIPPHLSMCYKTDHGPWGYDGDGGFLGLAHAPFKLVGGREETSKTDNMVLKGITLDRLQDRNNLLASLDHLRRDLDTSGKMAGLDTFTSQAVGILTSSTLADALDISKESPEVVAKYGMGDKKFRDDGAPKLTENFLIARRLVEAGARMVSLNFSRWDHHGKNFDAIRQDGPLLDRAVAALITDLHERGLDRDVSVVVWGEFGRTPKINPQGGRDHWPQVSCALIAGGGMRTGQVIGATNRLGEHAIERPVSFQEVWATLYHKLGLNLSAVREFDLRGRPQYLVDPGVEPLKEVI
ncbi:DUF1501 domain-containing protein [Anatilimnocola sp. NA78]|uniref:DUF1501 domain-containing protein n=1 Tax=Anatilimnocola sp. NA78 TaxID=3415683 RepID=UPI003CE4FE25